MDILKPRSGYLTSEGSLVITGRKRTIINSYGKVLILRIEALLRDNPGVNEVMLVGFSNLLKKSLWADRDYTPKNI